MSLQARRTAVAIVLAGSVAFGSGNARAQAEAVFGLVGGMIAAAQAQAAAQAWAQQPELQRYCLERGLSRQGASIERLIRAGMVPTDPRLNSLFSRCARLDPSQLKTGYRCTIVDENGSPVGSICNQRFARQESNGRSQILDARAAIDLHFANGDYLVVDVESDAGRFERQARVQGQQRIAELGQLRWQAERFRTSRSETVRAQADRLVQRIVAASNPASPPSEIGVAALRRDVEGLPRLESADLTRLSALDRLTTVKRMVETRAAAMPEEVKAEIARLNGEFAALAASPAAAVVARAEAAPRAAGPSFDCGKAKTALERVICSSEHLRRLDLEVLQPYYVLRHVTPEQRPALKDEAIEFGHRVKSECGLPDRGRISSAAMRRAAACVTEAYTRQRTLWLMRAEREAGSPARQEAARPLDEHVLLQARLQRAGLLPADDRIDGVFGGGVRTAITALQAREGLIADGLLSDAVAARLVQRDGAGVGPGLDAGNAPNPRIAELHRRYLALSSRMEEEEAKRRREEAIAAKVAAGRTFAREALQLDLPAAVKDRLQSFLTEADQAAGTSDAERLASAFDELRPLAEQAVTLARSTTPKNRFLVEGPLDDIFVLVNDTGRAPSVVKNLRGDFVFEAGRTLACQANRGLSDVAVTRQINVRLSKWGQAVRFPAQRCASRTLTTYDLVIASRGDLLKEPVAEVVALLSAVEANVFAVLISISGDEVRSAQQAEAVLVSDIETGVERETKAGFGVLALASAASGVVCQVSGEDREAHDVLLAPHLGRIAEETKAAATVVVTSADGAFVSAKRGQCGAVYAGAQDLKTISGALARDQIAHRFLPLWIEPEQVAATRDSLTERRRREVQQEADRRRRLEDEQRLSAAKASEEAVVKARREAELQQQYGAMARALEGQLALEMKEFVEGRPSRAGLKYPSFRSWYAAQRQDKWELMTVETALLDYGVSDFKGRTIETAFAKTHLKMRNRVLGEYAEHCFLTGFIADKEFEMDREPFEAPCDEADRLLADYRQGQRFASRWLVE